MLKRQLRKLFCRIFGHTGFVIEAYESEIEVGDGHGAVERIHGKMKCQRCGRVLIGHACKPLAFS